MLQLQKFLYVFSTVRKSGDFVLPAEFVFMFEPIVEKSRTYAVYFGLVEGHIVVTLGFVIGVEFLEFKV